MKKTILLTNTTDEMLLTWHETSALRKLQWLQQVQEFRKKAIPKKKLLVIEKLRRGEL